MRNIKMLGLLAVAAMALAAFVGTSAASATSTFTAAAAGQAYSTKTLVNHALTFTGSTIECQKSFDGETPGTSFTELTVTPTYEECSFAGFKATIDPNKCKIGLKAETDQAGMATTRLHGCDEPTKGTQVTVHIPFFATCVIDIPEQSVPSGVSYTNTTPSGGPMDLDVTFTETGIMYDVTTSTGLCPLTTGTHSGTNGATYTGETTFTAAGGLTWSA